MILGVKGVILSLKVRPVDEDDEPVPPPTTQKIVPRVQVVQQQAPPQQRQPAPQSQPPQVQQVSPRPVAPQTTQTVNVEGEAKVRYNFKAETQRELPCSKVRSRLSFLICFPEYFESNDTFLRTVPTFVTAHTFCASRDGPRGSDGRCLLIQRYFLRCLLF